jgi:regulator of CtrA degradation
VNEKDRTSGTIVLGPRIVASPAFDALYRDGMSLVEEVAAYLDGRGRDDSRALPRDVSLVYATESMRLTTRLMQLASWLLLQRAVREGEISADQARSEKHKVNFHPAPPGDRGGAFAGLPEAMRGLIVRGDDMYGRIVNLEAMERGAPTAETEPANAVAGHMARLQQAFGGKAK